MAFPSDASTANSAGRISLRRVQHHDTTMESPHPDERPHKKRRFFTEDSSPVQVRAKQPSPHRQTPPPAIDSNDRVQPEVHDAADAGSVDGFDVEMLQAVVGELSQSTLKKLKDVSGNNVERGRHSSSDGRTTMLIICSNQLVPRRFLELCCSSARTAARPASRLNLPASPANTTFHIEYTQAHRI